jgi:hypothetical protein
MPKTLSPTLLLRMDLDESFYNEETVVEIKRSYLYIAPVTVVTHPTNPDALENNLRFIIKLRRPYWRSEDEGADDIWENSMRKWLKNIFFKVSATLVGINRASRGKGKASLAFSWLELQFDELVVALRLGANTEIPAVTRELIDRVRWLSNSGLLKELAPTLIRLPSRQSYVKQEAAAKGAVAEPEAVVEIDPNEVGNDGAATGSAVDEENVTEAVFGSPVEDEDAPAVKPAEPIVFDIDFSIWGLEFPDGSQKQYDQGTDRVIA